MEVNSYLKRHDSNTFHSILVDTEPKILKPVFDVFMLAYICIGPEKLLLH
jgi:hypothetical protein